MRVIPQKCNGCKVCAMVCPLSVIELSDGKAIIDESSCANCMACAKVCKPDAIFRAKRDPSIQFIVCEACPIMCEIGPGKIGACHRFANEGGDLVRNTPLTLVDEVEPYMEGDFDEPIKRPLVTGIGAGSTYPCYRPAPFIVKGEVDGVEVVTCVTECAITTAGAEVKLDTAVDIGKEGDDVLHNRQKVGHVCREEYAAKMLSIGGHPLMTGKNSLISGLAPLLADLANRKKIKLKVRHGPELELQVGKAPVIDGQKNEMMGVGSGSAAMATFASYFFDAADEVIVFDHLVTGVFTEHLAGRMMNKPRSGISLNFFYGTSGRYYPREKGSGWGGTTVKDPREALIIDGSNPPMPGTTVLITEAAVERCALYRLSRDYQFEKVEMTPAAIRAIQAMKINSEPCRVSAVLTGGVGGSARMGIAKEPKKLTQAVKEKRARVTIGGAPAFILPGGGINFIVDVEKIKENSISWVPTPALVVPVEYTMRFEDYARLNGHLGSIIDIEKIKRGEMRSFKGLRSK